MNRRTFLKRLPIVAALPFLPTLPELQTPQVSLTSLMKAKGLSPSDIQKGISLTSFKPSGVEFIARNLNGYLAEINAVDTAERLEKGLVILLERNKLYG